MTTKERIHFILRIPLALGLILVAAVIAFFIVGLFMGEFCAIVAFIAVVVFGLGKYISNLEAEQTQKLTEKKAEQEAAQKSQAYAKPVTLVREYLQTANHSAQETVAAWEHYNSMLAELGVEKDGPVYRIYSDVYTFLNCQKPSGLSQENSTVWDTFYQTFATDLWNFYYQIAFTYALSSDQQNHLLHYLLQCFTEETEPNWFGYCRNRSFGNIDFSNWNSNYLALWKKGAACGSLFAIYQLAECYYHKTCVVMKDFEQAFRLYSQAAKLGSTEAIYMLGQCYQYGRGTKTNYQKAGDCYQYAYQTSQKSKYVEALEPLYESHRWDKKSYSPNIFTCDDPALEKGNLQKLRSKVGKLAQTDVDTAELPILAASVRMTLEQEIVDSFVEAYEPACLNDKLYEKIALLHRKGYFTKDIAQKATFVRDVGNRGLHNSAGEKITPEEMKTAIRSLEEIAEYYAQY